MSRLGEVTFNKRYHHFISSERSDPLNSYLSSYERGRCPMIRIKSGAFRTSATSGEYYIHDRRKCRRAQERIHKTFNGGNDSLKSFSTVMTQARNKRSTFKSHAISDSPDDDDDDGTTDNKCACHWLSGECSTSGNKKSSQSKLNKTSKFLDFLLSCFWKCTPGCQDINESDV